MALAYSIAWDARVEDKPDQEYNGASLQPWVT